MKTYDLFYFQYWTAVNSHPREAYSLKVPDSVDQFLEHCLQLMCYNSYKLLPIINLLSEERSFVAMLIFQFERLLILFSQGSEKKILSYCLTIYLLS